MDVIAKQLFSVGHSTRDLSDFLSLLFEHHIERLADIRRYPGSRRYPHFSREALSLSLPAEGIEYIHMPELGGRRKPSPDSRNKAWRNEQFRAYADHMASDEFRIAIDRLAGSPKRTAYMCAEAVPWRCHRNLVSDELTRRGIEVIHILGPGQTQRHSLNPHAVIDGDHVTYPL
jgi:uncharacterized protein (DUF488 family)